MINYNNLHLSTIYYEKEEFQRIELPWTVSKYVDNLTKPEDRISFELKHNNKCLVASGEQSFLYLYLKDFLPKGKFMGITPCYRMEEFDNTHSKYFMKNELIQTIDVNKDSLKNMVNIALEFFKQFFTDGLNVVETEIGFDIEIWGDELGSYGIRSNDFLTYIYGTACAEPRLSTLMIKYGIS